jgi:predicted SnoaL-like aldol condensation-catalyzing enzyme
MEKKKCAKKVKCKKCKKHIIKVPSENDPLRKFYVSLFRQKPTSEMAIKWLCTNGLGHIVIDIKHLTVA